MASDLARNLPASAAIDWLKAGVRDTFNTPASSLAYGLVVFLVSILFVMALYQFGFSYILLPVIAGFMVVGPMVAIGLYGKSRLIDDGAKSVSIPDMLAIKARSPKQLMLVSIMLMLLMTFWLRAAVMLYAIFFGQDPFNGLTETFETLFFTSKGNILLLVGSLVGGGLAALAFALSAFSIPMLVNEKKDTMTAMVLSAVIGWMNKPVVFVWGCLVLILFLLCVATGFIGLIVVFPILGHGTWHAYKALRKEEALAVADNEQ
jgi:uncharacterized membrane protein